jgi:ATPase subunit of ABC transporter with duplicated ATPase domains
VSRETSAAKGNAASKAKSTKPRAAGLEILSGAHLRIKSGGRYGFIGRNGSGKSSMFYWRSMSGK